MKANEIVGELRKVAERHKDDFTPTFAIRISDMATDSANCIEQLKKELEENQASVIKLAVTFGTFQVEAHKALQTNKALHKELEAAKRDLKFCPCCETCKRENEVNCFLEAEEDKCINFEWRGACENKEENT